MSSTEEPKTTDAPQASESKESAPPAEQSSAPESDATKENGSSAEAKPEATPGADEKPSNGDSKPDGATTEGKTDKDDAKRPNAGLRLSGAAKRRFRWLIDRGYNREEAAVLSKKPFKANELRSKYGATAGTKRPNSEGPNGPPSKLSNTGKNAIRMAVANTDFPASSFTREQAEKVKSAVLKQMLQQKDSNQKPHFHDCVYVGGYLSVHCSDQATVKWLQHTVPKLEPWSKASLKVVSEKTLAKSEVFIGQFADSRQDSNKDILNFIECQNDGVSTSKWAVITRKEIPKKQTVELVFNVDAASAKSIEKLDYKLNYKFNKVTIRKKTPEVVPGSNAVRGKRPFPSRGYASQQRSSSFVPIWDNNLPKRVPYPRSWNNRSGDQFVAGSNRSSNSNQYAGSGGFQSNGNSSSRLPSLINLYDQLIRDVSGGSNNMGSSGGGGGSGGGGYNSGSGRNYGGNNRNFFSNSRSGFF